MSIRGERITVYYTEYYIDILKFYCRGYINEISNKEFYTYIWNSVLPKVYRFNLYSLDACNSVKSNFFYFIIASYVFMLLFSFIVFLLGFLWAIGNEDLTLEFQRNYLNNELENICDLFVFVNIQRRIQVVQYGFWEWIRSLDDVYNEIFWWEPWSYEIPAFFPPFDKKFFNSPWHFYYKYRLSSWIRWHILEDRICIFVLFFLWILI